MMKVLIFSVWLVLISSQVFSWAPILIRDPKDIDSVMTQKNQLPIDDLKTFIKSDELYKCKFKSYLIFCTYKDIIIRFYPDKKNKIYLIEIFLLNKFRDDLFDSDSYISIFVSNILKKNNIKEEVQLKNFFKSIKTQIVSKRYVSDDKLYFDNGVVLTFYDTNNYINGTGEDTDYNLYIYMKPCKCK